MDGDGFSNIESTPSSHCITPLNHLLPYQMPAAEGTADQLRVGKMSLEDEVTLRYWLKDALGAQRVVDVKVRSEGRELLG